MATGSRHITRVGKRNQVTIPANMLRELGVGPGEQVEVSQSNGALVLRKAGDPIARASGMLHDPARKPVSEEELAAVERQAREERQQRYVLDDERIKRGDS